MKKYIPSKDVPVWRPAAFIIVALLLALLYIFSFFPIFSKTVHIYEKGKGAVYSFNSISDDSGSKVLNFELVFRNPVMRQIPDYLLVTARAANTGNAQQPYGSFAVNLETVTIKNGEITATGNENAQESQGSTVSGLQNGGGLKNTFTIQQRTGFYIDGLAHTYHAAIGENKFYRYKYSFSGKDLKDTIDKLEIEFPVIEGVEIDVEKIEFKKRAFFAADSYINYFFKNQFGITHINRHITRAYGFIFLMLAVSVSYRIFFAKVKRRAAAFRFLAYALIALLFLSGIYFIQNSIYTVKSYFNSYKEYIISLNLRQTYRGFYNFRDFLIWLDGQVQPGSNLIMLVRGQPVYIMAETAYNLYPRDIKFLDISNKTARQIIDEIISAGEKNSDGCYCYLLILSEADLVQHSQFKLIAQYRESSGFLFMIK